MFILYNVLILCNLVYAVAYGNQLHNLLSLYTEQNNTDCVDSIIPQQLSNEKLKMKHNGGLAMTSSMAGTASSFRTIGTTTGLQDDPVKRFRDIINEVLFGNNLDGTTEYTQLQLTLKQPLDDVDLLAHFPLGNIMRGELFYNKSAVHLPISEFVLRGHCYLKLSRDYMQTAVNAFGIFVQGNIDDVLRLPVLYVLKSARTISMMKLSREKMAATWQVVRGDLKPSQVPYATLELFRPLFKYLTGREMAKLNLTDTRILMYVGTHADLSRHQVGVVASHYIRINPQWREPKYLNLMNNLLCGVPLTLMRDLPESTCLQISNQVSFLIYKLFFHIRACDPLQRRFYLAMMSKTQILGKANSWSARDVHRLGLLVTEVDGPELATINPEALAGITAQLMVEMSTHNLKYITKRQLLYLKPKPYNILAKKMRKYSEVLLNSAKRVASISSYVLIIFKVQLLFTTMG